MKKFLVGGLCLLFLLIFCDFLYYDMGIFLPHNTDEITVNAKTEGKTIYLKKEGGFEEFEIKGVDMGAGKPAHFSTDLAITKEDYLRWFDQIHEMGANTIRVYTMLGQAFYEAVFEYNNKNPDPLYILHGVWVDDYTLNSHRDGYDPLFLDRLIEDSKAVVDTIHGQKKYYFSDRAGGRSYTTDISPWVIGYIVGVEWEDTIVLYTNHMHPEKNSYTGKYMQTSPEASPFEALLAEVGDQMIAHETRRYGEQRLVAFSNWPTTDPFDYPDKIAEHFLKAAKLDVEHIELTDEVRSGTFASYHIYPYFPDYLAYLPDASSFQDESGNLNTYRAYLKQINDHHTMPVVISEFGVPSSRGMACRETNGTRSQGGISEREQGQAILDSYADIQAAGCAGSVIFTWQDEWFKRTWNTMGYVDLQKTAFWSDYQTNEQYFGLLSFDPGQEHSVSYTDGDFSEWGSEDLLAQNGELSLSAKQDEKFLYLLVQKEGLTEAEKLYLPIDITPKTGALFCNNYGLRFAQPVDFVLALDGRNHSRLVVQERYEAMRAMFQHEVAGTDAYEFPPEPDTPVFKPIQLVLQSWSNLFSSDPNAVMLMDTYETGLLTYGNANPESPDFNSLADFCYGTDGVEIKLPWGILNFMTPAEGMVHDDYYLHYGIEPLKIKDIFIGVTDESKKEQTTALAKLPLLRWKDKPSYHERLKTSYYMVQSVWGKE